MKYLLTLLVASAAFAADPDSIKQLNEKYCELKVQEACSTLECLKNPDDCNMPEPTEKRKAQLEKQEAEFKKRCPKEDDHACILKENKDISKEVLGPDCDNGDQTACYFIEASKSL